MQRILLEPAFVLHSIAYRNTSLIVDTFTLRHGRVSVVARSARGPKSRYRGRLQVFSPLLISYSGNGELKSLSQVEFCASPFDLVGQAMMCGFYLNELLVRLLQKEDAHPALFELYQNTLMLLEKNKEIEQHLRLFEKNLLAQLGYGLALDVDAATGQPFEPEQYYRYVAEQGFVGLGKKVHHSAVFKGDSLLALYHEKLHTPAHLKDAKRLMRQVLARYLGRRSLKSRDML